jgi:hypothetical protein
MVGTVPNVYSIGKIWDRLLIAGMDRAVQSRVSTMYGTKEIVGVT